MPRYTISEVEFSPANRWRGDFAVRSRVLSDKWIDASDPEEAIAIYATRHGDPIGEYGQMGSRLIGREFKTGEETTLLVEVWPHEER